MIVIIKNLVSSTLLLSLAGSLTATVVLVGEEDQKPISYVNAADTKHTDQPSWIEKAADPAVSVPLFITLLGVLYFITSRFYGVHQELGRERFLNTVTKSIDEVLSERLDPKLDSMEKHIEWFHAEIQEVRRKLSNIQTRHYAIESKITEDEEIIDDYFEKVDDELSEILSEITGTQIRVRIYRNRRAQTKKGHTSSWYARYIDPSIEEQTKEALNETETPRTSGPPPGPSQDS